MKPTATLLILMPLFLFSCMTADKATGYLSAHREIAAGYCAEQFPVKQTTVGKAVVDSSTYLKTVADLSKYSDSVINVAAEKNDSIDRLKALVQDLKTKGAISQSTADVLQAQIDGIHKTDVTALKRQTNTQIVTQVRPCKDSVITITVENTAKSEAATLRADRIQGEKDYEQKWKDIWFKFFVGLSVLNIIYIFAKIYKSKLGTVARFIP